MFQKNRQIFYDIKYMGHNVIMHKKGIYYNLNPSTTKRNIIFILIAINEVSHIDNLVFFTERGEIISRSSFDKKKTWVCYAGNYTYSEKMAFQRYRHDRTTFAIGQKILH